MKKLVNSLGVVLFAMGGFSNCECLGQAGLNQANLITASDLVIILDMRILKFRLPAPEVRDRFLNIKYWVESIKPNGDITRHDETTIGIDNQKGSAFILRLPVGMDGEFGLFSAANSSRGKSKLIVDTEKDGSEAWITNEKAKLLIDTDIIAAVRIVGAEFVPSLGRIEDTLQSITGKVHNRIDVFKFRLVPNR